MSSDYMEYFPKPACYPNQKEAMGSIHKALLDRKIVLFEGACGTGKTLSALAPSLDVAGKTGKVVIIATNVHQQMEQFIEEAGEIRQQKDIRVAVLKGKKHMCPRDEDYESCSALTENTYDLINKQRQYDELKSQLDAAKQELKQHPDAEAAVSARALASRQNELEQQLKALSDRHCSYLYKVAVSDLDDFGAWYFQSVRTPEEVNERAYEQGMCGYELIKRQMAQADLVVCNFHHLLNFNILSNLLAWMDRVIDDVIVIFDEAHNLESAARSHSSLILPQYSLVQANEELIANEIICKDNFCRIKDMEALFSLTLRHLKDTYESRLELGERERLPAAWKDVSICDPKRRDDYFLSRLLELLEEAGISDLDELLEEAVEMGRTLDEFFKDQYKHGHGRRRKKSQLLRSAEFIKFYLEHKSDPLYYPILNLRREDGELEGRIELMACIPRDITAALFDALYAGVLMSATLQPFTVLKVALDIRRPTVEIAHSISFSADNRLTVAINISPLFARDRDDPVTIQKVTTVLNDIIRHSTGNVIIFFQSYHEARMYKDRITTDVPVYLDEIATSSQQIREDFFRIGESGKKAVILSYLWGTLTEGVDYRGGRGRTVVIVGIGYPALNDRMRAIEFAYEHEMPGLGWDYAIQVPTIRKVRQAMGRVLRSPEDYGVRVLLDGRYTAASLQRWKKYSVYTAFPHDEREEIIDVEQDNVKFSLMNFFNDMERAGTLHKNTNTNSYY